MLWGFIGNLLRYWIDIGKLLLLYGKYDRKY